MDSKELFEELKAKKWVWIIYILLTIPINLLLTLTGLCFAPLLMAFITFGIPYMFGVRDAKTFLKAGTVIILATAILFAVMYTHFMYNQIYPFEERSLDNKHLSDGALSPYLGDEATSFNYTVRYIGEEPITNITIFVNITNTEEEPIKSVPLIGENGLFYNETTIDEDVSYYHFAVHLNTTDEWIETEKGFGPITIPFSEMLGYQVLQWLLLTFMTSGILFYLMMFMYVWSKRTKEERMKLQKELQAEEEEKESKEEKSKAEPEDEEDDRYVCSSCDAVVEADATECWSCGETLEDDEEDEEDEKEG